MEAHRRKPPTTGLYCLGCGEAQLRAQKGKPCKHCGEINFVLGLVHVEWAALLTIADRDFLKTNRIGSD